MVGTVEEAIAADAPLLHEGELRPGLFHGLGKLAEREGNVCYRYRLDAGSVELAEADAELTVEGEYEFPAVYQYAMETHTVVAEFAGDELTLWASCQHPFLVRAELADLFKLPLGRVRVIVPYLGGGFGSQELHEDGAGDRGARLEGGAAGADPEPRRRVDGDHPPPRDALPDADHGERGRQARLAQRAAVARHRRLRRQRPPRLRHRRRCRARPLRLGRGPRRRQLRLHQHLARGLLSRLRRRAPAVDRRDAGRRARPPRRDRSARDPAAEPAAPGRAGAPGRHRQAARRRPGRRRRKGGGRDRLGRAEARVERARGLGRAARRRRPPGLAGERPDGGRRQRRGQRRDHRDGPGGAHGDGPDRRPGAGDRRRRDHGRGRRHPLHPL